jgi:hypothetical protein
MPTLVYLTYIQFSDSNKALYWFPLVKEGTKGAVQQASHLYGNALRKGGFEPVLPFRQLLWKGVNIERIKRELKQKFDEGRQVELHVRGAILKKESIAQWALLKDIEQLQRYVEAGLLEPKAGQSKRFTIPIYVIGEGYAPKCEGELSIDLAAGQQ